MTQREEQGLSDKENSSETTQVEEYSNYTGSRTRSIEIDVRKDPTP